MATNYVNEKPGRQLSREDSENSTNEQAERVKLTNGVHETRVAIPDSQIAAKMAQSTDSMYSARKRRGCGDCLRTTFISALTSVLTSAVIIVFVFGFLYYKPDLLQPRVASDITRPQAAESRMLPQPEIPTGSFWSNITARTGSPPLSQVYTIDPEVFKATKSIRWISSSTSAIFKREDAGPIANGCVRVRRTAGYFLFLRVTYNYNKDTESYLYMSIVVKREGMLPNMIAKNTLTLPENRVDHGFEPSYIADYQVLQENDNVCVIFSDNDAVYATEMDAKFMLLPFTA